jgi:hypothetical protein
LQVLLASRWVRRRREPFSLGVGTIDETTNSPEHFLREKLDRLALQQQQFSIEDPPVPDGMPTSFGKQFWQILVDQVPVYTNSCFDLTKSDDLSLSSDD